MYLNFEVELPDQKTGISKKKIKGTTYIYYEYGRKYLPDRKYNVPQCTSIGKLSDNNPGMMIPNSNYLKYFPDAELRVGSVGQDETDADVSGVQIFIVVGASDAGEQ